MEKISIGSKDLSVDDRYALYQYTTRFLEVYGGIEYSSGKRKDLGEFVGYLTEKNWIISEIEGEGAVVFESYRTPSKVTRVDFTLLGFRKESSVYLELVSFLERLNEECSHRQT